MASGEVYWSYISTDLQTDVDPFDVHIPAQVWFKAQQIMNSGWENGDRHFILFDSHYQYPPHRQDAILEMVKEEGVFQYRARPRPKSWIEPVDAIEGQF